MVRILVYFELENRTWWQQFLVIYISLKSVHFESFQTPKKQESVRPRWPYDMRPSVRAEKYIRDASGAEKT